MKKLLCILLACAFLLLGACSDEQKADERWPVEIDGYTFTAPPVTAVSLSPSVTETLYVLGYGGRLTGISDFCRIPESADALPRCGSPILPDLDDIRKLSPDLLLTAAPLSRHDKAALEGMGVQVVVAPPSETLDGILQGCRLIVAAFEGMDKAQLRTEELTSFFEVTLDYIAGEVSAQTEDGASAIYLRRTPFVMATGESLEGKLLERIGFENPADGYTDWSYPADSAADLNPDYIFCDDSISIEDLQASDYYKETEAVLLERVFTLEAEAFERRSPRLLFALEELMKEAFPEGFEEEKPNFVIDIEPPPEPEKTWWQELLDKF